VTGGRGKAGGGGSAPRKSSNGKQWQGKKKEDKSQGNSRKGGKEVPPQRGPKKGRPYDPEKEASNRFEGGKKSVTLKAGGGTGEKKQAVKEKCVVWEKKVQTRGKSSR